MSEFKFIKPEELVLSPFQLIGKEWMLVTAAKEDGTTNTMTAAWGGMGVMWGKNVCFIVIRPQRYTKEFIDASDKFSLSFYDASYKKELSYLGKVSGRDEDKIAKAGLTTVYADGIPYFKEAKMVITCKNLYHQNYLPECFIEDGLDEKWYPEKDYHTLYIAEISNIYVKE